MLLSTTAALAALALAGAPVLAQAPAPAAARASGAAAPVRASTGPTWASLNTQQRSILAPLERDWGSIDAPRKAKWIEVASRFPTMPATDQQRVRERMAEWARMTPAERGSARLSFQESKQMSPEQKQARWEAYQALPDEQRKALATRAKPGDEHAAPAALAASGAAPAAKPVNANSKPATAASAATTAVRPKPVTPTVVQAKPGATTTLMTAPVEPPVHHRPGQPKIAAQPGQVNPSTLLPQRGPQAAASASARQP